MPAHQESPSSTTLILVPFLSTYVPCPEGPEIVMRISNSISHKIYILDFLLSLLLVFNFATLLDLFLLFSDFFFFGDRNWLICNWRQQSAFHWPSIRSFLCNLIISWGLDNVCISAVKKLSALNDNENKFLTTIGFYKIDVYFYCRLTLGCDFQLYVVFMRFSQNSRLRWSRRAGEFNFAVTQAATWREILQH